MMSKHQIVVVKNLSLAGNTRKQSVLHKEYTVALPIFGYDSLFMTAIGILFGDT